MTHLAPLWRTPRPPQQRATKAPTPAPAPPAIEPATRATPAEPRRLTLEEGRSLSIEAINTLIPQDPKFVADMIINSGKIRRAELPLSPFALRPAALFCILCGKRRRAEPLTEAETDFFNNYLAEADAA